MQEKQALVAEQPVDDVKQASIVLVTDMLNHADDDHLVEVAVRVEFGQIAVVRFDDVHRQPGRKPARVLDLLV
ncbi:hypothetical protein D3C83_120330 [compost metagenome]